MKTAGTPQSAAGPDPSDLPRPLLADGFVGLASLGVYLATLAPTITTGDSGDLIAAAARFEVAHPTGYPLYLLLGRVWLVLFGFLEPALALNLFSAFTAALAVVLARRLVETMTGDRWVSIAAALLFGYSASFWSQATAARVYVLSALLALLVLGAAFRPGHGRRESSQAFFWLGLALANHPVTIILAPVLAVRAWKTSRRVHDLLYRGLWVLPGLLLYLSIPVAARRSSQSIWGRPDTWDGLIHYLLRLDYWDRGTVAGSVDALRILGHYLSRSVTELSLLGVLLVLAGLVLWRRRYTRWEYWIGPYLFVANLAVMAAHGSSFDIYHWNRYLILGWLGLVLAAGLGMAAVVQRVRPARLRALLLAPLPLLALVVNWEHGDRSGNTLARDFAAAILDAAAPRAVILAESDTVLFPLMYLHRVEHRRPDVELVMLGVSQLGEFRLEVGSRPVYLTHFREPAGTSLHLVLEGPCYRLEPSGRGLPPKRLALLDDAPSTPLRPRSDMRIGPDAATWALPSFEGLRQPSRLRYNDRALVSHYWQLRAAALAANEPERATAAALLALRLDPDWPLTSLAVQATLARIAHTGTPGGGSPNLPVRE